MQHRKGLSIVPDPHRGSEEAFTATTERLGPAAVTIRFALNDRQSGADITITNMTTLPYTECRKGYGSAALRLLLDWAAENGHKHIIATQVQRSAERFWMKNGFEPLENRTNDFELRRNPC